MKRILALAAVCAVLSSCEFDIFGSVQIGNGVRVDSTVVVDSFDAISAPESVDFYYTQTPGEQSVVLTCDENLTEFYEITSERGILSVGHKKGNRLVSQLRPYITVKTPDLKSVSISGSGDFTLMGDLVRDGDFGYTLMGSGSFLAKDAQLKVKNFSSETTGSGDVNIRSLEAADAKIRISGSGSVKAGSFKANGVSIVITGSGAVRMDSFTAEKLSITISGSGDIDLDCKDAGDIEILITGSGDVRLRGNARSLSSRVSGSGRVDYATLQLSSK